jgi:acetolactate synthase-1/2/3 large subunit
MSDATRTTTWASTTRLDEPCMVAGSHILCDALRREGVQVIFGYPGGAIIPFYDALSSYPSLHHVLVRHEQAAAHAADGYARATGKVGVCVATSGPGVTNLVTGLATAYMDSVPLVAITGQVPQGLIGRDAFQEIDTLGITQPITKHSFLIQNAHDIAATVHEAFRIAKSGRPGPVLIDIPRNIQVEKTPYALQVDEKLAQRVQTPLQSMSHLDAQFAQAAELIAQAHRPLIMAGHGVILSSAFAELAAFAEKTMIPVVTTLLGISAFPATHQLSIGMPGLHGAAHVNRAIGAADLIIGVGLRFDDRVTGLVSGFAPHAKLIHIDIDPSEIHKVLIATVPLVTDARAALIALYNRVAPADHHDWLEAIRDEQRTAEAHSQKEVCDAGLPDPQSILKAIHEATQGDAILVTDVGQHQMWTARYYPWTRHNSHITSGGQGTMGFALPAALGIKMGIPNAPVWVIVGDGGIQMNIQELATLQQEGVELKIAIMNNGYLGMVRQQQEFYHAGNYSEVAITSPDYVQLADAYGIQGRRIEKRVEVASAVQEAMRTSGTVLIDFVIEATTNVYPTVIFGKPITSMIE